jgi:hypothetical protein
MISAVPDLSQARPAIGSRGIAVKRACIASIVLLAALTILRSSPLIAQTGPQGSNQKTPLVSVPFVGCKSDGQGGPVGAPEGAEKIVQIDASAAKKLAYYKADNSSGVLAPRGWFCVGTYGSSGSSLFVTPQPIKSDDLLSVNWAGIVGPGIQFQEISGDTSGRFQVAAVIARVFPTHKAFVESVINVGVEPASAFPFGPYPQDRLTYRSDQVVEFQTPAHSEGLGTASALKQNDAPIAGVALLEGETPDLLLLTVRLPPDLNDLTSQIIQQVERDSASGASGE